MAEEGKGRASRLGGEGRGRGEQKRGKGYWGGGKDEWEL